MSHASRCPSRAAAADGASSCRDRFLTRRNGNAGDRRRAERGASRAALASRIERDVPLQPEDKSQPGAAREREVQRGHEDRNGRPATIAATARRACATTPTSEDHPDRRQEAEGVPVPKRLRETVGLNRSSRCRIDPGSSRVASPYAATTLTPTNAPAVTPGPSPRRGRVQRRERPTTYTSTPLDLARRCRRADRPDRRRARSRRPRAPIEQRERDAQTTRHGDAVQDERARSRGRGRRARPIPTTGRSMRRRSRSRRRRSPRRLQPR